MKQISNMFPIEATDVNIFIKGQLRTLIAYILFSALILIVGFFLVFFAHRFFVADDKMKNVVNLGGGFITTLTTFPLRIVLSCYDKISLLKLAQSKLLELPTLGISKREVESRKVSIFSTIDTIITKPI